MVTKALVLFSGGIDSTVALMWSKQKFDEVRSIFFDYNQLSRAIELESAKKISGLLDVSLSIVKIPSDLLQSTAPLVDHSNKLFKYENASQVTKDLAFLTFIPCRNTLFFTVAANHAYNWGCLNLVSGIASPLHREGNSDTSPEFASTMQQTLSTSLYRDIKVWSPLHKFVGKITRAVSSHDLYINTKADAIELGYEFNNCQSILSYTTTCFAGNIFPCGTCESCVLRAAGFEQLGIKDPLLTRLESK